MSKQDRTIEEWAVAAQSLKMFTWTRGWSLLPDRLGRSWVRNWCRDDPGFGFTQVNGNIYRERRDSGTALIDVDHPGNGGFLLGLLDAAYGVDEIYRGKGWRVVAGGILYDSDIQWSSLGRAVINVAEHLGELS